MLQQTFFDGNSRDIRSIMIPIYDLPAGIIEHLVYLLSGFIFRVHIPIIIQYQKFTQN